MSENNFKIKRKIDSRSELIEMGINIISIILIGDYLQEDKSGLKILTVLP